MFKDHVRKKLEKYVRKYFLKYPEIKLIVVAGSVGKTSTKAAIATVLTEKYRVRMQIENHNSEISTPMAILGIDMPEKLRSFWAWQRVFSIARKRIKEERDVDIIVQELGSDHPGDMAAFGSYLVPDLAVVTAVTPEHMENFSTIENVAKEELSVANFSKMALINREDINGERFAEYLTNQNIFTYGDNSPAEYSFTIENFNLKSGFTGFFETAEYGQIPAEVHVVGEHSVRPVVAAVAVAAKMELSGDQIKHGVSKIKPISGRMNILEGTDETIIIDDTYNSSPAAAQAAMSTFYTIDAPLRIVVLGDMNELGNDSPGEHEKLGSLCDPNLISWVVTIGKESGAYLAPAAKRRGCQVQSFLSAIEAGGFVRKVLDKGAVILFKGSQNGVFAEEAVKMVLKSTSDEEYLVRQSPQWMEYKRQFFQSFNHVIENEDE